MAAEDIESPPYPNEGTTADGLLASLKKLKDWVNTYRVPHNEAVTQELIPVVKDIPQKKTYLSLPVYVMVSHLLFLRKVRERWDYLVRTYENDWDDEMCLRQRVMLLASSAVLLNNGFVPHEQREFRKRTELDECQRTVDCVATILKTMMEGETYEPKL